MRTFVELAGEATGKWREKAKEKASLPTYHLRSATTKEPWPGARWETETRVVQWMTETRDPETRAIRAVLLYDVAEDCQFWLPGWLWQEGSPVGMQGEAGPVEIPRYLCEQLDLA